MTRITILGGKGYVGSHLAAYFQGQGYEVFVPERGSKKVFENHLGFVVYAIGLTADFRTRPFDTIDAHVTTLGQVLRNSSFDSFLYLSSTRVYGRCEVADEETELPVQPGDPSDLYNLSKLMGESLALNCGREGVRVARLSNVVGGYQPSDSFVARLLRDAKAGEIRLETSTDSQKDFIHISDAVRMLGMLATKGTGSIYNVGGGVQISNGEWVDALREKFKCKVLVDSAAPNISFPRIKIDRFIEEFSYQPGSAMRAVNDFE
jgi:nucleoside-diphosphate-sugar epimerase